MATESIDTIALCGGGLSLWMTAAALSRALPDNVALTIIETTKTPIEDMFYGHILPPQAYAFHLSIDLSEPELLLNTGSTFVYGTHFQNWGQTGRSWVQAFHQPLPVWDGVPLTKLIHQLPHASLQSALISAQAANGGVFAHPSEDPNHPLSRAEYGYAIDPEQLSALYRAITLRRSVNVIPAQVAAIERDGSDIRSLKLSDGRTVSADIFIDCTGPAAKLQSQSNRSTTGTYRSVQAARKKTAGAPLGAASLRINSGDYGWRSDVVLRSGAIRMTVSALDVEPNTAGAPNDSVSMDIQCNDAAWTGNCIAIGQAAYTLEPFTTAPMKLLMRDIERFLNLIPVSTEMAIEADEYNRAFRDDYAHASLFNQAHFAMTDLPDAPYWNMASERNDDPKLVRKLTQYNTRGHLVAYDNEPFDGVDWAILHDGIGRTPRRRDPLASSVDPAMTQSRLNELQNTTQAVIKKMPPHPLYMSKFISYLKRKYARNG
jgi:tryptophan halogenase